MYDVRPVQLSEGTRGDGPDVDLVYQVVHEADLAVIGKEDGSRGEVRSQLTGVDAVRDEHRLVLREGVPVGALIVEHSTGDTSVFADCYAVPAVADDLLPKLVGMGYEAAQRISAGSTGWRMECACYANDEAYEAAVVANGLSRIRRFWRMQIDLSDASPDEPAAPPGVTVRVVSGESDRRLMHAIHDESFGEHFGHVSRPYEEWMSFFETDYATPDRWWIASLDGDDVAVCLLDDSRAAQGLIYVRSLGVLERARGRGIGAWLLRRSFAHAVANGYRGARLTVDSDNITGAARLYESVGMSATEVIDVWAKEI